MHTWLRRLIWALLFAGVWIWICGCASRPPAPPPRFVAPSTAPIEAAHKAIKTKLDSAQSHVTVIATDCPGAKAEIDALSSDLAGAQLELVTSENERVKLDAVAQKQTAVANWYADNYTVQQKEISELKESRHGWVKQTWVWRGIAAALTAWILRKPLGAVAKWAIRIFAA